MLVQPWLRQRVRRISTWLAVSLQIYKGITGTHVVEVLFFDKDGVVRESYVHYASA